MANPQDPHDSEPIGVPTGGGGMLFCRLTRPLDGATVVEVLDEHRPLLSLRPEAAGDLGAALLQFAAA